MIVVSSKDDFQKTMDLPPDKLKNLRNCDLKKKWDLVCDQRRMYSVTEPSVYLEKLSVHLDKKTLKKVSANNGTLSSSESALEEETAGRRDQHGSA